MIRVAHPKFLTLFIFLDVCVVLTSKVSKDSYPLSILHEVVETMMTTNGRQEKRVGKNRRPAVIPYIHRISHNIKRVAKVIDIKVVLSAPVGLKRLRP